MKSIAIFSRMMGRKDPSPKIPVNQTLEKGTPARACQTIYDREGRCLFLGEWDPISLYRVLAGYEWAGKKVLDIGANTCGLSIEIARAGASVTALEPAPYANDIPRGLDVAQRIAEEENLDLVIKQAGIEQATLFGAFDVVLCLGLVYHFRDMQFILDHISSIEHETLFVSTQTATGSDLTLVNRRTPGLFAPGFMPDDGMLSGWHPTRPLFERMLAWAGYSNPVSLTDRNYDFPQKQVGLTNTAYYRAQHIERRDPIAVRFDFYPR